MSSYESQVSFVLDERTAELKVVDARFHVIRRGVGGATCTLKKGVYKVLAATAGETVERLFVVDGTGAPVKVEVPPIRFRSAAPLDRTSSTHEYHQYPIAAASQAPATAAGLGTGTALLFALRDPGQACIAQRNASAEARARYRRSYGGFSLHGPSGAWLHDLASAARFEPDWGYLVSHLELAPGHYTLLYRRSGAAPVAMPMYVTERYQAQVFVNLNIPEDLSRPAVPDLRERMMILAPTGKPFHADDPALRALEIARRAYSQRRFSLAPRLLEEFMASHGGNPLLGLFAIGLSLQASEDQPYKPLAGVWRGVNRLLQELGDDFPDVAILQALMHGRARTPNVVSLPPLLRASWQRLQAEDLRPSPELSALLSRASNVGTWLVWTPEPEHADKERPVATMKGAVRSAVHGKSHASLSGTTTEAVRSDPNEALDLFKHIAASDWWDDALRWLREHGTVHTELTSLQATLLAAIELARTESGNSFAREDFDTLTRGLRVSDAVVARSLSQLGEMLVAAWAQSTNAISRPPDGAT